MANHPGVRGYDAGKKIEGRKRHLVADTFGIILGVVVTGADVSDRAGALEELPPVLRTQPRLAHHAGWPSAQSVSLRSAVERTFGWLMQARRLVRDYETKTSSSEAMILLQASRIMLRRLAK